MTADVRELERAEIEAFVDLYRARSPEVESAVGMTTVSAPGAAVLAATRADVLALNRAVGLGLDGPPSEVVLDELLAILARVGSPRFFVPVAPFEGHQRLRESLEARGLRHYNNWVRLSRGLADLPPPPPSDLVVREIGAADAPPFGRIVAAAFGYPAELAPLTSRVIGRPGWSHYLAYAGETPVGAAAMYRSGATAWFGFAATDAAHRNRGAQHALVARRLADARAAGCTRVSVETAEDTVVKNAPSFRNLQRLGFTVGYTRPNYLWRAGSQPAGSPSGVGGGTDP